MGINQKKLAAFAMFSIKVLPFIIIGIMVIVYFLFFRDLTVNDILNFTPKNLLLASIVITILYAVKSIVIAIPILFLYVAVGAMYSPVLAIIINIIGVIVCLTIPYYLGRFSGNELLDKILEKYPKAKKITEDSKTNGFFFSYMIHVICPLPGDIVSILSGAMKIPFWKYLIGSVIGSLPYMIATTFLGTNISNPLNPLFLISSAISVFIAIISYIANIYYKKYQKRQKLEIEVKGV